MATTDTQPNVVQDKIMKFYAGKCSARTIGKFKAAVHVMDCDAKKACWTTIACGLEIPTPEYTREAIRVEGTEQCNIFEGSGLEWAEYEVSDTAEMGEWQLDLYYTVDRLELMWEWFKSGKRKIVVIDVADSKRTQLGFMGLLTTWNAQFAASSDTEVAMIPTTLQPTGVPYKGEGAKLNFC